MVHGAGHPTPPRVGFRSHLRICSDYSRYLLHGPPGSGKTTLGPALSLVDAKAWLISAVMALASALKVPIYVLNLNAKEVVRLGVPRDADRTQHARP